MFHIKWAFGREVRISRLSGVSLANADRISCDDYRLRKARFALCILVGLLVVVVVSHAVRPRSSSF